MIYLKIIIFLCMAVALSCFFYQLKRSRFLENKILKAQKAIDEASVERARMKKKLLDDSRPKSFLEKMIEAPEKDFIYSGMGKKFQGLTIEIWILLIVGSAAALYFLIYLITRKVVISVGAALIYIVIIKGIEKLLVYRNYKITDNMLLHFLNQMGNFSLVNGEITAIFHQVSRYLPEPLKGALEECYYDAQTSGDTAAALYFMADKIEHPKFKEIIYNIEICINYTSDFNVVVSNCRKSIMDEQRAKRERKAMADEAVLNMFILSLLSIVTLICSNYLIDTSIWQILFNTAIGKGALFIIGVCYLILFIKIASAEK